MRNQATKSFELFEPGKKNGYWTNKDLVEQVQRVMPLFESLHQNSELVIVFDNSQNHHMTKEDGLDAGSLNLKKPKKVSTEIRDGYFVRGGVRVLQHMMEDGLARPLKDILEERGLWQPKLCKGAAAQLLKEQPDFTGQKEWLTEVIESRGHQILYLPKFHCELNPIERVWAHVKHDLRKKCEYSLKSLRAQLPVTLENVSVDAVRRYFRRTDRYVSAYAGLNGVTLTPTEAAYVTRKYSSHRRIPAEEIARIVSERGG